MAHRKQIDWEAIEKEYRLGQKTIRLLASEHDISHTAINKRARKENGVQDKSKEVREKTKAALLSFQREVSKQVSTPTQDDIQKAVQTNIAVVTGHRKSIGDGKNLIDALHGQLKGVIGNREELEDAIWEETKGENTVQRRNAMLKAVSLSSNAGTLRDLSMALKNLIPLERQAFGIDEDNRRPDSIEEITVTVISPEPRE